MAHNAGMMRSITNVVFGLAAFISLLIGAFFVWFMYEYSLRWLTPEGAVSPGADAVVVFGREGAWWIGGVAAGWFILAALFWLIHHRVQKRLE